jgi:hypothetical protein
MATIIENELSKRFHSLVIERERRIRGDRPIRQDVIGEWILENHRVNKAAASSMIGEIIDKNSEIYESILDVTKHLFGCLDVDYSIRGYWPEWCDAGFYVIRVEKQRYTDQHLSWLAMQADLADLSNELRLRVYTYSQM